MSAGAFAPGSNTCFPGGFLDPDPRFPSATATFRSSPRRFTRTAYRRWVRTEAGRFREEPCNGAQARAVPTGFGARV